MKRDCDKGTVEYTEIALVAIYKQNCESFPYTSWVNVLNHENVLLLFTIWLRISYTVTVITR